MATALPPKGDADKKIGAFFAPLSVAPQDVPNMTVKIRAGSFFNSTGDFVEYAGGNSPTISAPVSQAKWVVVALTDAGVVTLINGTIAATPSMPSVPVGYLPLAAAYVSSTTTAITQSVLTDIRPIVASHGPTLTDLTADLALKADIDGTPNTAFSLNKSFTAGSPSANASLAVKRGNLSDVAIRWNESLDQWEFTNDGATYNPIAATVGVFAPVVHTHVSTDITDFATAVDAVVGALTLNDLGDVVIATPLNGQVLTYNGANWVNQSIVFPAHTHVKADITDFVEADYVHIAGTETVTGDKTFTGAFAWAQGVFPQMSVTGVSGDVGFNVARTGFPANPARIEWDQSSQTWQVGIVGVGMASILATGNFALKDLSDVSDTLAPAANDVLRFVGGTWTNDPLTDKANDSAVVHKIGDTMTGDLAMSGTQSVTGLRAATVNGEAVRYNEFNSHTSDATIHFTQGTISITASQVSDFTAASQAVPHPRTTQAAPYPIIVTDEIVLMTGTGNATLPVPADGKVLVIKNIDVGSITVVPNAAETIDGGASFPLLAQYDSVTLVSDGTNWFVV